MTADVFFGLRRMMYQHMNEDVILGVNYFGVRLENGQIIFNMWTNNTTLKNTERVAGEIVKVMKEHEVTGFRSRGGCRLRHTNGLLVFCAHAWYEEEFANKLGKHFEKLELTELNPPPVHDERIHLQPRRVIDRSSPQDR